MIVRDAQRNARDTDHLIELVRSAAEMRNSFEDMKKLVAEQEAQAFGNEDNQRSGSGTVLGGPQFKSSQKPKSTDTTDGLNNGEIATKRRNVFKRALKGLKVKNSDELARVEQMLVQLLGQVEDLKAAHGSKNGRASSSGGFNGDPTAQMSPGTQIHSPF